MKIKNENAQPDLLSLTYETPAVLSKLPSMIGPSRGLFYSNKELQRPVLEKHRSPAP